PSPRVVIPKSRRGRAQVTTFPLCFTASIELNDDGADAPSLVTIDHNGVVVPFTTACESFAPGAKEFDYIARQLARQFAKCSLTVEIKSDDLEKSVRACGIDERLAGIK